MSFIKFNKAPQYTDMQHCYAHVFKTVRPLQVCPCCFAGKSPNLQCFCLLCTPKRLLRLAVGVDSIRRKVQLTPTPHVRQAVLRL